MRRFLCILLALITALGFAQADRKIEPGDKLKVTCAEETAVSGTYDVTEDGLILVTFLGQVKVQDMTAQQASTHIAKRLTDERIVQKATVTVEFLNNKPPVNPPVVNPPVQNQGKVKIAGEVKNVGDMDFRANMRLADVIRHAEPLPNADLTKIMIRNLDGRETLIDFSRFDPATNVNNPEMRVGDTVSFPLKDAPPVVVQQRVFVIGGVQRPGMLSFAPGMTLRQAIDAAGGFSSTADKSRVRVERNGQAVQVADLSLPGDDVTLMADDQIVVEVVTQRRYIQVNGLVRKPGMVQFYDGMTLSRAIHEAGGLMEGARTANIEIKSQGVEKPIKVNFDEIERGYRGDYVLKPGDTIAVPNAQGNTKREIAIAAGAILLFLLFGS